MANLARIAYNGKVVDFAYSQSAPYEDFPFEGNFNDMTSNDGTGQTFLLSKNKPLKMAWQRLTDTFYKANLPMWSWMQAGQEFAYLFDNTVKPIARGIASVSGTTVTMQGTTNDLEDVHYGNGMFMITGDAGTILTSRDGITWTSQTSGVATNLYDALYMSTLSLHIVIGAGGVILTSPDGITWTSRTSGVATDLWGLETNATGSIIVAAGAGGVILTSTDGITWTSRTSGVATLLNDLAWGASVFVVVGNAGVVLTSPDGITWTSRTSNTAENLRDVAHDTTIFAAVGANGAIITSPDGVTAWTVRTSGTAQALRGVNWCLNQYIAVGANGVILTSTDAITWTSRTSGTTIAFRDSATDGKRIVTVGLTGMITSSYDAILWGTVQAGDVLYFRTTGFYEEFLTVNTVTNGAVFTVTTTPIWSYTSGAFLSTEKHYPKCVLQPKGLSWKHNAGILTHDLTISAKVRI